MPHCNKQMLSFFLTTMCNLCCIYCYNAKERNKLKEQTIPLDVAKAAVDWYFEHNESRHIRFYGPGEPTQAFGRLKEIVAYAKSHPNGGDRVTVEIQTNGVFTEEVRDYALNNFNIMWMSFDGMPDIQNHNRPLNPKFKQIFGGRTSAQVLEDNVKWLNDNKGNRNLMVGARCTITNENLDKQIEMIDYFSSLGIKYVWTDPLFQSVGQKPVCEDPIKLASYSFNMDGYVDNYIDAYRYAKDKGIFWGSFLAVNFDGESPYHCRACTPLKAPHITTDAHVSACDMALNGSNPYHMSPFIVGKWNGNTKTFDWDYDKIKALNERKSTNMDHCKGCPAQKHCGGYCPGETTNNTGNPNGKNPKPICTAVRRLWDVLGAELSKKRYEYFHP